MKEIPIEQVIEGLTRTIEETDWAHDPTPDHLHTHGGEPDYQGKARELNLMARGVLFAMTSPYRVLVPIPPEGDLTEWRKKIEEQIKAWKDDPMKITVLPTVGGEDPDA